MPCVICQAPWETLVKCPSGTDVHPPAWALSARGPGEGLLLSGSSLYASSMSPATLIFHSFCPSSASRLPLPQVFAPAVTTAWNAIPSDLHLADFSSLSSHVTCSDQPSQHPNPLPAPEFSTLAGLSTFVALHITRRQYCFQCHPLPHIISAPWCGGLISGTSVSPAAGTVPDNVVGTG